APQPAGSAPPRQKTNTPLKVVLPAARDHQVVYCLRSKEERVCKPLYAHHKEVEVADDVVCPAAGEHIPRRGYVSADAGYLRAVQ
ncbi:MAG: hypothetical protein KGI95_29405, partial [Pseudomonas sp.]|nr:hypothetical protein [Pseudomonas sp.]